MGLLLAIWYGSKSKAPSYAVSGTNLVSTSLGKYDKLRIVYGKETVARATVTNLVFWNAGRETIRQEDIAPSDPIRVNLQNGAKPLSCNIVKSSRKVIRARLDGFQEMATSPRITFDFLDNDDWILLQVLHTGGKPDDCTIAGTVMGCKHGIRKVKPDSKSFVPFLIFIVVMIGTVYLLGLVMEKTRRLRKGKDDLSLPYRCMDWMLGKGNLTVAVLMAISIIVAFAGMLLANYALGDVPRRILP